MKGAQHVKCGLHLRGWRIPQLQWEVAVSGCKGTNEVCLECLDGALSCNHSVIVGFDEEIIALLCVELLCDYLPCLVIHHIHFQCMSLGLKKFELLLIGGKDCVIGKISDWW
jgi:hypothetical protein